MAIYYEKKDRWILLGTYLCFGPGVYFGSKYQDLSSSTLIIPEKVTLLYFYVSTLVFCLCKFSMFYLLKVDERKKAISAIIYESLFNLYFIVLISWISFASVAFQSSKNAFMIAVLLQLFTFFSGCLYVRRYCLIVWGNGLFNSNSKRWNFSKMTYSIVNERLYENTWPEDSFLSKWQPGKYVSWGIALAFCIFFALTIHGKGGHGGSLILDLAFRNDMELKELSNSILFFVITQIALWIALIPSFILKILEIIKIRQIENEKGAPMLIKQRKSMNSYFYSEKRERKLSNMILSGPTILL